MAWTILAVICSLIFWLIVKAIREYERPRAFAFGHAEGESLFDLEPAQAPGDLPADVYLVQARTLADQGRYREAVVQLLLGAMSRVERSGWERPWRCRSDFHGLYCLTLGPFRHLSSRCEFGFAARPCWARGPSAG